MRRLLVSDRPELLSRRRVTDHTIAKVPVQLTYWYRDNSIDGVPRLVRRVNLSQLAYYRGKRLAGEKDVPDNLPVQL